MPPKKKIKLEPSAESDTKQAPEHLSDSDDSSNATENEPGPKDKNMADYQKLDVLVRRHGWKNAITEFGGFGVVAKLPGGVLVSFNIKPCSS